MATDSIVAGAGLFTTPEQYQEQQRQALYNQAVAEARLDPYQQARVNLQTGVQGLAQTGAGMMGAQDPQMQLMAIRKQVLQGLDPNDSASITKAAQALAQAGDQQGAMQLAQKALEMRNTESQISGRTEQREADRADKLTIAREKIQARLDEAERKGASDKEIAQMKIDAQKELKMLVANMGGGLTDLKKQILEAKLETEKEKKASAAEATTGRLENLIDSTANVMTTIEKAKGQVSGTTAGMGGRLLGWTTSATDLEETLNTVKANLGFDRLQQMRNESKTGGALGQVAVKELERLEAARASLNRAQSPEQLKSNLDNVYQAYSNWRTAATRALEEKKKLAAAPNATPTSKLTFEQKVQRTMADPANAGKTRMQVESSLRAAGHN
jgi:hypothetical protein